MYLGIDCGTQGTKALLIDEQGIANGRGHATHQLIQRSSGADDFAPTSMSNSKKGIPSI